MMKFSSFWAAQDCFLCGATAHDPLCNACAAEVRPMPAETCPICAAPSHANAVCGRCLKHPPAFDATRAALIYEAPTSDLIQAFKYRRALGLDAFLARHLMPLLPFPPWPSPLLLTPPLLTPPLLTPHQARPTRIIAMPLSDARLKERGYNQALALAKLLARAQQTKVDTESVIRARDTPPQAALPWAERARNIKGAFLATRRFDGETITVVDDVMTTGSTLDELARTLKAAGAARVENLVLARVL
jgi:ComF family protein